MNDNRPIGIFDSGLGGLTVYREIRKMLPGENLIYFGDSGRAPYGTKSVETVRRYTESDIGFLLGKGVKTVVVACNTAAACSGRELLDSYPVPVIDVIDAGAEEAVKTTRTGKIGVIGTSATIGSGVYQRAIQKLRPDYSYMGKACPLFVPLVEEGWWDGDVTRAVAREYLRSLTDVDTLVLGCTHYPFLEKVIGEEMGPGVTLVNSAKSVAKKVLSVLREQGIAADRKIPGASGFYTSDSVDKFSSLGGLFLGSVDGPITKIETDRLL